MRSIILLLLLITASHQDNNNVNLPQAMKTVFDLKEGEELDFLANTFDKVQRVIKSASPIFEGLSSILDNYKKEEAERLREILNNASAVIQKIDDELIDLPYEDARRKMSMLETMLNTLGYDVYNDKGSKYWVSKSCEENSPREIIEAIEHLLKSCVGASADLTILDLMAKHIGYKYSEAATQYTRIYFYLKSAGHEAAAKELKYLSAKYEADSRYDKPTRLNNLLNEMNLNVYDSYNPGCTFEYSLVAKKFQRKYVLRKAVTMAQHVVQLGYQGTMCAYLTQTKGTNWETLNEIEESIKSITVLLNTVPASILNSTWPSIQIRQIKEIIEEIPEDSIDQTNGSFAKIAAHIYKKQAAVGHPIYKLQILVIPYSSRNIEDNTKLWYSCRPNVCQLIQREEKFNVLAIRVEGSGKEDSSNSSELQQYVDSIKPKILEEFDIRYRLASSPKSVAKYLARYNGIDLAQLEHHQGVIILHSQYYHAPCRQKMAFYQPANHNKSIEFYYEAYGKLDRFCHHWNLLFV